MRPDDGFVTFRGVVYPAQCDAMGHLTIKEYMGFFDQAEWHCFLALGFDPCHVTEHRVGWADARHEIIYQREVMAGSLIQIASELLEVGGKSLKSRHRLLDSASMKLCAELTAVTVQYDLQTRKARPLLDEVRRAAEARVRTYSGRSGTSQ